MKEIIVLKKMYAEIRKWENNPTIRCNNVMRLLKLYIGMGIDHLMDKDGRIHCKDFNKVANILHSRNPRTMIDTVVNSESFVCEKCNSANTNIYGIMWFASPLFATGSASVQSSPTSDKSSPTSDLNSPTSDLNSPTRDSVVGEFHLLNKYIKDLSNIPSGGIACAHASDSWGVAPTATWNFRTRKNSESMCLCVQNKNLITRIYHISRTASDMGLPQRT